MKKNYYLTFKWTVSRGRNTYGYNICSLYVNGTKVSTCNGGGYDMQGTCFGDWIEKEFQEDIKNLDPKEFYGLMYFDGKMIVDGACGMSSILKIVDKLGYSVVRIPDKKIQSFHMYK